MPDILRVRDYCACVVQYTVVAPSIVIIFYHNILVFVKGEVGKILDKNGGNLVYSILRKVFGKHFRLKKPR